MTWLLFALFANLLYSGVNIVDQLLRRHHVRHDASLTILWVVFFFFAWLAIVPFIDVSIPSASKLLAMLAAGFIDVLVALPYYHALSVEEVSRVTPIWQFSSLFVLLFSSVFLGEVLMTKHFYGFAAMFFGGLLLGLHKTGGGFRVNKAVLLVFASSVAWAVHLVLVKFFYTTEQFWNGFFWLSLGSFLGVGFLLAVPKNLANLKDQLSKLTKKTMMLLLVITVASFLAEVSFLLAVKGGPVSLVSVLGSTQMIFLFIITVILSKYFPRVLKEKIDRKTLLTKSAAISLMIFGLYLIR